MIDAKGRDGWAPGQLLSFDAGAGRVDAAQPKYRPDASVELALDGDRLTDTVTVATSDGASHEIGLLVQTQGKATLPASFAPDGGLTAPGRPAGFRDWTDVRSAAFTDTASFSLTYANGRVLQLEITVPGPFTVTRASALDALPQRREVFFIRVTGTQAIFRTVYGL